MLRAEGLRKAFGGQVVLDGVNVELHRGQVVLLRGENGSGKTTLLNILTGNLEPDAGSIHYLADGSPRTYRFPRRWWQELNPFDHFVPEFVAREGMGRTWQDVRLFGSQTLRENITVAEPGHPGENPLMALIAPARSARKEKQLRDQADTVLSRFGLAGREDSSADKISLGQSKRVAIARAVAAGAKILFLDEPLAGLDRQGIADVLSLLKTLVRDHTLTLVIVEHVFNQPHLQGLVTTDWLLESGKLISSLRQGGEQSQLDPSLSIAHHPSPIVSRPAWFHLLAGDNAEIIDEPLTRGALLTRIRRPDRFKPDNPPILEIRDLVVKRGPRVVIGGESSTTGGMNLTLQTGEIAILQAPNGWGKSSLFSAICGHIHSVGNVLFRGQDINLKRSWDRARAGLVGVGSNDALFPSLTIRDAASLLPSISTTIRDQSTSRISSLSGGERQRAVMHFSNTRHTPGSSLAIYDEPFAMLDHAAAIEAARQIVNTNSSTIFLIPSSLAQQKETV
ncbi:MAG TPA: ATP-binding cassette domain-containing protein [Kiritimatiellia bacterium]|nr:ATP-binding cassette domain-containing protein [Kiritimatiellia bacterium]